MRENVLKDYIRWNLKMGGKEELKKKLGSIVQGKMFSSSGENDDKGGRKKKG